MSNDDSEASYRFRVLTSIARLFNSVFWPYHLARYAKFLHLEKGRGRANVMAMAVFVLAFLLTHELWVGYMYAVTAYAILRLAFIRRVFIWERIALFPLHLGPPSKWDKNWWNDKTGPGRRVQGQAQDSLHVDKERRVGAQDVLCDESPADYTALPT